MSGSPPPEPTRDPSQLAGRRRKRSDTPPTATSTPTVSTLPALIEHTATRYGEQPLSARGHEEPRMQLAPHPVPFLPPLTYGAAPGAPLAQYLPQDAALAPQQISPRSTRKTKAHVASACVNCKRKHLRCDNSRPCRRCVQQGKEDTCKDVEHKKRGRPPLKPEDPTVVGRRAPGPVNLGGIVNHSRAYYVAEPRGYSHSNYPPILPNAPAPMYGHGHGHHRGSSRSSLYGGLQSPYAPPTVAPSPLTVTATGFSYATRPASTTSTASTQSGPPYMSLPSYAGHRPAQSYTGYFSPVDVPPTTQPFFSNPIFPRDHPPPPMQIESQYSHGLQLPPIRPAQPSMIDPRTIQHRPPPHTRPEPDHRQRQRQESDERDAKRPKMDIQGILGPRND